MFEFLSVLHKRTGRGISQGKRHKPTCRRPLHSLEPHRSLCSGLLSFEDLHQANQLSLKTHHQVAANFFSSKWCYRRYKLAACTCITRCSFVSTCWVFWNSISCLWALHWEKISFFCWGSDSRWWKAPSVRSHNPSWHWRTQFPMVTDSHTLSAGQDCHCPSVV